MIPGPNYRLTNREIILIERTAYVALTLCFTLYVYALWWMLA